MISSCRVESVGAFLSAGLERDRLSRAKVRCGTDSSKSLLRLRRATRVTKVLAMPRYFALLRGINVGGHRVKMERQRRCAT